MDNSFSNKQESSKQATSKTGSARIFAEFKPKNKTFEKLHAIVKADDKSESIVDMTERITISDAIIDETETH